MSANGDPWAGGIHFLRPIRIGEIVEIDARPVHTSEDAMHIATRMSSAPASSPGRLELTTVCMSIFIEPLADSSANRIRSIALLSDEDVRLDAHARELIEMRAVIQELPRGLECGQRS